MSNFYCQLDYEHVPYLSPVGAANGNISNNGCGVCSASMVAENMLGVSFPPEEAARFAKMCGARETWGTNFYVMAPAFAAHMGLTVRDTEDAAEALRFLQEKRGMVIANTQGDREADGYIGVFSNSGHYIVIAEAEGTTVKVWDPMYKEGSGRYDVPGRKGKVRLDGTDAYADMSVLAGDCKDRPFFLFEKPENPLPAPIIGVMQTACGETLSASRNTASVVIEKGGIPVILNPDMPLEMVKDCVSRLDGLLVIGDGLNESAEKAVTILESMNKPVLCMGECMKMVYSALGGNPGETCSAEGEIIPVLGTRFEAVAGNPGSGEPAPEATSIPDTMRICAVDAQGKIAGVERREGALFAGVNLNTDNEAKSKLIYALVESARV